MVGNSCRWMFIKLVTLAVFATMPYVSPAQLPEMEMGGEEPQILSRTRRFIHHHQHSTYRSDNTAFLVVLKREIHARRLDILKFDKEETDVGNHYNMKTGEFIAPVPGTYVFALQLMASAGTYVEASIQRTSPASSSSHFVNVVKAVSDKMGVDKTVGGQGSTSAVLRLDRGQKVTVSVSWIAGKDRIQGGGMTSFSGYLLR